MDGRQEQDHQQEDHDFPPLRLPKVHKRFEKPEGKPAEHASPRVREPADDLPKIPLAQSKGRHTTKRTRLAR